jgi:signal peptidase I
MEIINMQVGNQKELSSKPSILRTCFEVVLSIIFGLQGLLTGIGVIWLAYIFAQSQTLHLLNILFCAVTVLMAITLLFLAFRISKQKWYVSFGLFVIVYGILSPVSGYLINKSTDRMRVTGNSMESALAPGDLLIVDRLVYQSKPLQRGDVIVYTFPAGSNVTSLARVIGLPGEVVQIKSGQLFINDVLHQEPSSISTATYSGQWEVGASGYFVLGDNRNSTSDSHMMGSLATENIQGKVIWIYWPFSKSGPVSNAGYTP